MSIHTPVKLSGRSRCLAPIAQPRRPDCQTTMSDLPQLLRTAHRRLAQTPALSIGGVMCHALGIGATTATWSAASQALLRPLPFGNPDRLVAVHRTTAESGPLGEKSQSPANY